MGGSAEPGMPSQTSAAEEDMGTQGRPREMEAEIAVMGSQAEGSLKPQEARRGKKCIFSKSLWRNRGPAPP